MVKTIDDPATVCYNIPTRHFPNACPHDSRVLISPPSKIREWIMTNTTPDRTIRWQQPGARSSTGVSVWRQVGITLLLSVLLMTSTPGRAQDDDFWDEPFREPLYLVHISETSTMYGPVEKDIYILYPTQPEDGTLLTADGSGGYFINKAEPDGGPFTTRRQVCSATQGMPPEKLSLGFSCSELNGTGACMEECREYHGPHGVGQVTNGECTCDCEEGYEPDGSLQCVPTKASCDQACREYHGTDRIHGPEALGKVTDGVCNCYCKEGYVPDSTLTCVKEKTCKEDCSDQWGPNTEAKGKFPDCQCPCKKGYDKSATSHKCEESCAAQCKEKYGWKATGTGDPALPCNCSCTYPWQWNKTKTQCIEKPRYIDDANDLDKFLRTRGYSESHCPKSGPLPAGSVKFWKLGSAIAHTSVVLSKNRQIEMGNARDKSGKPISAIRHPTVDQPQADPQANVGTYVLHQVLCPPPDAYVDERGAENLANLQRYGERAKDASDDWNCHGFSANLVNRFVETFVRVRPDTNVNWDQMLEIGAIHGLTPAQIAILQGKVSVRSEYVIEVEPDRTATIYLIEGSADYQGMGHAVSLSSGEMTVIDVDGIPSAPARFDLGELDRWWEDLGQASPPGILGLDLLWGAVALFAGLSVVVLGGALFFVWQRTQRRRQVPATGPGGPAGIPGLGPGHWESPAPPPARAWGKLTVLRGEASARSFSLEEPVTTFGRSSGSDLVVRDRRVSKRHAQIRRQDGSATLYDLHSTNGTFVNGERITDPRILQPGDVIRMGETELVFDGATTPSDPPKTGAAQLVLKRDRGEPFVFDLAGRQKTRIGRSRGNDLVIRDDAHVSRRHALIQWTSQGHEIVDLGSRSGIIVNGRRTPRAHLHPGDRIRLGTTEFLFVALALPKGFDA